MLTIRDCKILREAYSPNSGLTVDEAGRLIGNPTDETLIGYACEQMSNPDRNVRVLMLRLLAHQTGAQAAHGVLSGLCDDQRRVCAVAIQACATIYNMTKSCGSWCQLRLIRNASASCGDAL